LGEAVEFGALLEEFEADEGVDAEGDENGEPDWGVVGGDADEGVGGGDPAPELLFSLSA
jgi:hypothetical protein